MARKNVYASDLEVFLNTGRVLLRGKTVSELRDSLKLVKNRSLGTNPIACMVRYDQVRGEMLDRIDPNNNLLFDRGMVRFLKRNGYSSPVEFVTTAKESLERTAGLEEDYPCSIKDVLQLGEDKRKEMKESGEIYFDEYDPDPFHPMGRIDESEIGQAINKTTVKSLIRTFKRSR